MKKKKELYSSEYQRKKVINFSDRVLRTMDHRLLSSNKTIMQLYTWIFSLDTPLTESQKAPLDDAFQAYLDQWNSHGRPLKAQILIRHHQFIMVQADPSENRPSGCSIDALKRAVIQIMDAHGLKSVDASKVFYKEDSGKIASLDFRTLPEALKAEKLHAETPVFDHSLGQSDDLSRWEVPLQDSWMKRFIPKASLS